MSVELSSLPSPFLARLEASFLIFHQELHRIFISSQTKATICITMTSSHSIIPNEIFHPYPKIHETKSKYSPPSSHPFCVTEKCHGSNFVFVVNSRLEIQCAKRKEFLDSDDTFFGFRTLYVQIKEKIRDLVKDLHQQFGMDDTLYYVYGELAGGFYPGTEQDSEVPSLGPVQTGIWYSNQLVFYGFDIAIQKIGKRLKADEESAATWKETDFFFLDYEDAVKAFKKHNIFCAEPLFVGNYQKCLEYPMRFKSMIPQKLGMPAMPSEQSNGNLAEGVVIKPWKEIQKDRVRPMTKLKIQEFNERSDVYDQSSKSFSENTTPLEQILFEMYPLITENRVDNAISKVGAIEGDPSKAKLVLQLFVDDVLQELQEQHGSILSSLMHQELNTLKKELRDEGKKCIVKSEKRRCRAMGAA